MKSNRITRKYMVLGCVLLIILLVKKFQAPRSRSCPKLTSKFVHRLNLEVFKMQRIFRLA